MSVVFILLQGGKYSGSSYLIFLEMLGANHPAIQHRISEGLNLL